MGGGGGEVKKKKKALTNRSRKIREQRPVTGDNTATEFYCLGALPVDVNCKNFKIHHDLAIWFCWGFGPLLGAIGCFFVFMTEMHPDKTPFDGLKIAQLSNLENCIYK